MKKYSPLFKFPLFNVFSHLHTFTQKCHSTFEMFTRPSTVSEGRRSFIAFIDYEQLRLKNHDLFFTCLFTVWVQTLSTNFELETSEQLQNVQQSRDVTARLITLNV